jgi:3-oxoacyl-[acyl-carrier-protein] synthase-3
MPRSSFTSAAITGVVTCVPTQEKCIDDDIDLLGGNAAQIARIKSTIGLDRRRVAPAGVTALDLCERAARELLATCGSAAPDGLIFVTQTPDHFQPGNGAILHGRLGLPETCAAFDVALGCSGYVYGLWLAHQMVAAGGCSRVLLLAGDTMSRCVNARDRAVAPLFGDAGSATIIERAEGRKAFFALNTDGRGARTIIVPAGAFRERPNAGSKQEEADAAGNVRSREDLFMDGGEVFNFSIRVEPRAVQEICDFAGVAMSDVDHFVFHQANRYIITNIVRRLKVPMEKAPADTVSRFGNQSSASIPCTICDALAGPLMVETRRLVLSGFGVGLSWGTALLEIGPLSTCRLVNFASQTP